MITPDSIEKIRDTARIEDVVGDYVQLKRRGVNMIGLCPFHDERTPSFTVSPAKGLFKCFGCGKGGDSIRFLMEHEHFTYPEALKFLAKKYNIEIEETESSPEQKEEQSRKEALFAVNAFAEEYFAENLFHSDKGKAIGYSYFVERGFSDETIRKFKLGYALEDWDHLLKTAQEKGYKPEFLKELGLVSKGEKTVDIYRGRVMFPIHNISGRVLGFGGRILNSKEKAAKYINSPESEIYNKSKTLYGLFLGKKEILAKDKCYLVEGYTDVISLHQAGIENVVASSGTSLTIDQVKQVRRFTNNITILYDGDKAGIKASFRGIDMILEEGLNVRVLLFPDGDDPDSFSKKVSSEALKAYLDEQEQDFIRFKASVLLKEAGNDPIKKAGMIHDMVDSISLVKDSIARSIFLKECSILMDVEEKALYSELNKILRNRYKKDPKNTPDPSSYFPDIEETKQTPQQDPTPKDTGEHQEKEVIRILLNFGHLEVMYPLIPEHGDEEVIETSFKLAEIIVVELSEDVDWVNPIYEQIFKEIEVLTAKEQTHSIQDYFVYHEHNGIKEIAIELVTPRYNISQNWEKIHEIETRDETDKKILRKTALKALFNLKLRKLDETLYHIVEELKATQETPRILELLEKKKQFDLIQQKISHHLDRVKW